jgi:ribonuclease VapC
VIVDTSALVAILRREPDADDLIEALLAADTRRMSAPTYVETAAVVDANRDPVLSRRLDELIDAAALGIEPFTDQHARTARQAYRDFGRGSGHPARLNLGDCFAYALAAATQEPLLFTGDDFVHTDLRPALSRRPTKEPD